MPFDPAGVNWQQLRQVVLLTVEEDTSALRPALEALHRALPEAVFTLDEPSSLVSFIHQLESRSFEAAIVWTPPGRSPHALAYGCYLAGIPIRVGQSQEFGGGVLSPWVRPPIEPVPLTEYYLHLLRSAGILAPTPLQF
ncbi:MAG: hypothetical protein HC881_14335 [Leptolyngbyaceae cyanobacterium SL_7_1]|nr:hypothetical protein [Leptolyngbyaceae cyanobacterium SL_7_1]